MSRSLSSLNPLNLALYSAVLAGIFWWFHRSLPHPHSQDASFFLLRLLFFVSFLFFFAFRAILMVYGSSQASGRIGAAAAGLHHSHSNARSKLCLWATPQLMATLDPWPIEWGQGSNTWSSWILVGFVTAEPQWELPNYSTFKNPDQQLPLWCNGIGSALGVLGHGFDLRPGTVG